ncbi:MAG TPA: flagellar motor protein MotB [Clostridia bacterium]|nr:flagellar motor protein MotB [Clostridia bacterium]
MGKKVEKDTSERWLLTYSDLMNLLLIVFILMYSMSQIDSQKFNKLAESLREAFGTSTSAKYNDTSGGGNSVIQLDNTAPSPVVPATVEQQAMDSVQKKVEDLAKKGGLEGKVDVKMEERGIVISMTAQFLFRPGRAEIESEPKPTLVEIGKLLKAFTGNRIRVEGHTDSDPLSTSSIYIDNQGLSSARADNVLRLLVKTAGVKPKMISSAGYGDTIPVASNTTVAGKAKNRRVDIVILKNIYSSSEPIQADAGSINKTGSGIDQNAAEKSGSAATVSESP